MAFEGRKKLHKRRECGTEAPYFKLIESRRDETRGPGQPDDEYPRYWRLCAQCESKMRTAEFALWYEEQRTGDPMHPDPKRVHTDMA